MKQLIYIVIFTALLSGCSVTHSSKESTERAEPTAVVAFVPDESAYYQAMLSEFPDAVNLGQTRIVKTGMRACLTMDMGGPSAILSAATVETVDIFTAMVREGSTYLCPEHKIAVDKYINP